MNRVIIALLCLGLISCGGSGDDSSSPSTSPATSGGIVPFYGGVYSGVVERNNNGCPIDFGNLTSLFNEEFPVTVNQDARTVVLDTSNGSTFAGGLLDDNTGFKVTKTITSDNGNTHCLVTIEQIFGVFNGDDGDFFGGGDYACTTPGQADINCHDTYLGTVHRGGTVTAAPIAAPTAAPTVAPTAAPTAVPTAIPMTPIASTPTPTPQQNSCDKCNLRGCCSSHGGVAVCPGGAVVCMDGSNSPKCTC